MDKVYLNSDLLIYYKSALLQELELGNIDADISTHLIKICDSKSIRPIFSKKGNNSINNRDLESYLRIAFTQELDFKRINLISKNLKEKYSIKYKLQFSSLIIQPYIQKKREITTFNKSSKWLIDPNYFNVSQIEFRLKKGDKNRHQEFWNDLTSLLLN